MNDSRDFAAIVKSTGPFECSECDAGLSVYDTYYSDGTVVSKCDACGSHSLNFWHPQDTPKWAAERIGR